MDSRQHPHIDRPLRHSREDRSRSRDRPRALRPPRDRREAPRRDFSRDGPRRAPRDDRRDGRMHPRGGREYGPRSYGGEDRYGPRAPREPPLPPRGRAERAKRPVVAENMPLDPKLRQLEDDPRVKNNQNGVRQVNRRKAGRNTESFDPESTLVRPDLRVLVAKEGPTYGKKLKHDDVVIVPEFFCKEDDWDIYYKLVEEIRELQSKNEEKAEWIPWHEGCHLITKGPEKSPTFQMILRRITEYFNLRPESQGYRFNWYRDSSDWKPFHHDSAAFNPQRAKNQNITVGISFGATRELAFLHAGAGTLAYFPQVNGGLFTFGRDVNIRWKHGINALPPEEQHGKGRISIVVWGHANDTVDEEGSPPMVNNKDHGGGRGAGNRPRHRPRQEHGPRDRRAPNGDDRY